VSIRTFTGYRFDPTIFSPFCAADNGDYLIGLLNIELRTELLKKKLSHELAFLYRKQSDHLIAEVLILRDLSFVTATGLNITVFRGIHSCNWYKITNISQKSLNYFPKLEAKYSSEGLQIHNRTNVFVSQKTAICRSASGSCRIFPFFFFFLLFLSLLLDLPVKLYPRSPKNNRHTASKRKECDVTHLCLFCRTQREREREREQESEVYFLTAWSFAQIT
jgi:hypothetical protein